MLKMITNILFSAWKKHASSLENKPFAQHRNFAHFFSIIGGFKVVNAQDEKSYDLMIVIIGEKIEIDKSLYIHILF